MVLDEGGGGDRSGKEGAVTMKTGDLGGGLEVAELLMRLRHGGREGGVGAGAVTVTGDPSYPVFAMGMELPASGRPVSPADDQRPCFNFPGPPTLKTSSSDLERKQGWLFCSSAVPRPCLYHLQQRNVIREKPPPEVGSAGSRLPLRVIRSVHLTPHQQGLFFSQHFF